MIYVTILDIAGLTAEEYRAVLDRMSVETRPASDIYLHLATPTDAGFRIVEIWDSKAAFEDFLEQRLSPTSAALGINRKTTVTVTPLHNLFAPRLSELPGIVSTLPGAPLAQTQ